MGVDYGSIGGVGIEFTAEMVDVAIKNGVFSEDEWEEDEYECLGEIGLKYREAGNAYAGVSRWYLLVNGDTLDEVNENSNKFIARLAEIGISVDKLDIISDLRIW